MSAANSNSDLGALFDGHIAREFVDDLVFSDGAGDGRHLRIFGDLVYEVLAVKATDFPAAEAPR